MFGLPAAPSNAAFWTWQFRHGEGERSMMGLGSYPMLSLEAARRLHEDPRRKLRVDGVNPLADRSAKRAGSSLMTFKKAAETYIAAHDEAEWKRAAYVAAWRSTLLGSYCAQIADLSVAEVTRQDVLKVLAPIWSKRTATATQLRGRIEKVLGWAVANGHHEEGDNPASWASLEHDLPGPTKIAPTVNRKAVPYRDMPDFVRDLRARRGDAGAALSW